MKKTRTASARKTAANPSSVLSQLWAAVHPKPALPLGHPIPRLTPPPVPSARKVPSPRSKVQGPAERRPAAVERLASFLSLWLALALLTAGCAGPRPLKGGKAATVRKPAGVIEQTVVQGENASQPTKQDQESVKVRTYTVPAGSRMEPSPAPAAPQRNYQPSTLNLSTCSPQLSTLNPPPPSS